GVDVLRLLLHEAHVVEGAAVHGRVVLVQRQVVVPRAEVDVLRVRLPDDAHTERLGVETGGGAHVAHLERHVAQAADPYGGHARASTGLARRPQRTRVQPRQRTRRPRGRPQPSEAAKVVPPIWRLALMSGASEAKSTSRTDTRTR